jgi:hypothetical protein
MNIDVKSFNKILANQIQQLIKNDCTPWSNWVYARYARMFQHTEINKPHIAHQQIENKNYVIFSIHTEKVFNKFLQPFMIKTSTRSGGLTHMVECLLSIHETLGSIPRNTHTHICTSTHTHSLNSLNMEISYLT